MKNSERNDWPGFLLICMILLAFAVLMCGCESTACGNRCNAGPRLREGLNGNR